MHTAPQPYIGITGFVSVDEALRLRPIVSNYFKHDTKHRFMAGVLVSGKTLRGDSTSNRRYPFFREVENIVKTLSGFSFTTIHFNTRRDEPLGEQLIEIFEHVPFANGVQLNIRRPDPVEIQKFLDAFPQKEIILQVNGSSLKSRTADEVNEYICSYEGLVHHALLDLSGGNSKELDPDWILSCLGFSGSWLSKGIRPGIAGGLGAGSSELVRCITEQSPRTFSLDAEGMVRSPVVDPIEGEPFQDLLDVEKAMQYLQAVVFAV